MSCFLPLGHYARASSLTRKQSTPRVIQSWQVRHTSTKVIQRRDNFWIPTISLKKQETTIDATELLSRAGYLRQAYSGIYHMLPLGLRVQEKLERLIDKHMRSIDASKVSLSSISSQQLWSKSGRLAGGSEFFKFADRKSAQWLLAPTHEEEITTLIAEAVHSPNQLPVRLYQISRKYRDEKRPRGGLLRGREFIMKDLYTFDMDQRTAHATYEDVRQAYRNFLDELKIKYVEARADSGNMGGNLSHEYHFPSTAGEDDVISCDSCDYARNEEWVPESGFILKDAPMADELSKATNQQVSGEIKSLEIIGKQRTYLIKAFAPLKRIGKEIIGINTYAVKAALKGISELDTGVEHPRQAFAEALSHPTSPDKGMVFYVFDQKLTTEQAYAQIRQDSHWLQENDLTAKMIFQDPELKNEFTLLKQVSGDSCPQCSNGKLSVEKAIEIGHTFHLGTRYSSKLDLAIKKTESSKDLTSVEMGCHGIGVSRLVAAVASSLSDRVGLNWPRVIAPFEVVLIVDGRDEEKSKIAAEVYEALSADSVEPVDTLLDDRSNVGNIYKLKDADVIGYPVILVVGRTWQETGKLEIQCRRLGIREEVELDDISTRVREILAQL